MSDHPTPRDEPFMRAAAWIGDLGNPFYDEERNRDVWNEASAVGFQLFGWLSLAAAAISVWVVGADAVPYAIAIFYIVGAVGLVTIAYAWRLGIRIDSRERMHRVRMVPLVALLLVLLTGILVRTGGWLPDDPLGSLREGLTDGSVLGFVSGAAVVLVPFALIIRRLRSRQEQEEADLDLP